MDILRERKEVTLRNFENAMTACDVDSLAREIAAFPGPLEAMRHLVGKYFILSPERAENAFMPALDMYEREARERAGEFAEMGRRINDKNFRIDAVIANAANMTHAEIVRHLEGIRKI